MDETLRARRIYVKIMEIRRDFKGMKTCSYALVRIREGIAEISPGAENRPEACAVAHEIGPKRQFSLKTCVLDPLGPEKWPRRRPMDERLRAHPVHIQPI
ncbi:hypothetical protein EJB05_30215, partial [Eragrostis curvula]